MTEEVDNEKYGIDKAVAATVKLLGAAHNRGLTDIENLCKKALFAAGQNQQIVSGSSDEQRKQADIAGLTPHQARNFSLRFGFNEALLSAHKQHWFSSGFFANSATTEMNIYEDVTDPVMINAPITDICLVHKSDPVPDGYYRLSKTLTNKRATLNYKSGGNEIYLCIRKDTNPKAAFLTNIIVIYPDKNEIYPPGYIVVRRGSQVCNVNTGTSAERIFLCYKKERIGNPITDILVMFPGKSEAPPPNYFLLDNSPSGIPANLNAGTGGGRVYLCYRQIFAQYMCLENELSPPTDSPTQSRIIAQKKSSKSEYGLSTIVGREYNGHFSVDVSATTVMSPDDSCPAIEYTESCDDPTVASETNTEDPNTSNPMRTFSEKPVFVSDSLRVKGGLSPRLPTETPRLRTGSPRLEDGTEPEDMESNSDEEDEGDAFMTNRGNVIVTNAEGGCIHRVRRLLLLALLGGMGVRQLGIAADAISGVLTLLNNSDFFKVDLDNISSPHQLTMLDMVVEALCDRIDICQKAELPLLLQFIMSILKKSKGKLSQNVIRRLFVSLTTLLTFHSGLSRWLQNNHMGPCLEGGSPFEECDVLDEMITSMIAQVENEKIANNIFITDSNGDIDVDALGPASFCGDILCEFIDDIIDSVEACKLCDAAQGFVATQTTNVTSQYFWRKTNSIARALYSDDSNRNSFVLLCALCRLAWPVITVSEAGTISSRELGTKLLALDMLQTYCRSAGEKMTLSKVNGYQIRRIVVPCILNNISFGLREPRVFSKIMKLISCLWTTWRMHLRIEFANLCEQLCIRILQASVVKVRPIYQMIVLREMEIWLGQPHLMLEMFVNFDMDDMFVSHWNIFSHLVRAMCTISKRPDNVVGLSSRSSVALDQQNEIQSNLLNHSVTVREVNMKSMEEVAHVAKTLMDATGHAFLMKEDSHFRSRSITPGSGWEQDDELDDEIFGALIDVGPQAVGDITYSNTSVLSDDESAVVSPSATPVAAKPASTPDILRNVSDSGSPALYGPPRTSVQSSRDVDSGIVTNSGDFQTRAKRRMSNVGLIKQQHQKAEELIGEAVRIYEQKSSLKKALQFLIKKNFLANTPSEIAGFLRVYKNSFDPSAIGDYLGEGGLTPAEQEYWSQIRYRYTRAISFVEMELEPALRLYLTGCGFRLPGEAQKIDRFVETFQITYWADNHGTQNCPLKHPDTVHILTFAIIMLNTDLHRASSGPKNKKRAKMTKEEFINNLRGSDKGDNIDRDYLCRIYDNIAAQPIELAVSASETEGGKSMAAATGGVGISSGGTAAAPVSNAPVVVPTLEFSAAGEKALVVEIARNVRDSEDLLRQLSQRTYHFSRTGVDAKLSLELVSFMFETVWLYFRDLTEVLLSGEQKFDTNITLLAVDILCSSLTSSIFLGLNIERRVFAERLEKFQLACVAKSVTAKMPGHSLQDTTWSTRVTTCKPATTMETIAEVHKMISVLKETIEDTENYEISKCVAAKIEKKAKVLDKNTFFVREGDLKKQNRNGKLDPYRFFLFSDTLLYCHQAMLSGEYIVHEQLPLQDMRVSDNFEDHSACSVHIGHPIKSFFLHAESPQLKRAWLRDLQQTIMNCNRRIIAAQVKQTSRKLSVVDRIAEQKKTIDIQSNSSRRIKFALEEEPHTTEIAGDVVSIDVSGHVSPSHASVLSSLIMQGDTVDSLSANKAESPTKTSEDEIVMSPFLMPSSSLHANLAAGEDDYGDGAVQVSDIDISDLDINPLLKDNTDTASVASSDADEPSAKVRSAHLQSNAMDTLMSTSGEDTELHPDVEEGFQQNIRLHPASNPASPELSVKKVLAPASLAVIRAPGTPESVVSTPGTGQRMVDDSSRCADVNGSDSQEYVRKGVPEHDEISGEALSPLFEYDV
jgi:hypothetical protein